MAKQSLKLNKSDKFDLRTGVVALAVFAGFMAWLVWGVTSRQPQVAGSSTTFSDFSL